ncbi:MAG: AAA family ATPase [Bacilli bacterium]|nr:AAA family ATPase [Bacilli bacterium]
MRFFGRTEELDTLRSGLATDNYQGFLIYGRRHVGKSALIMKAVEGINGLVVFYQCIKAPDKVNIDGIFREYQKASGDSLAVSFNDLSSLVEYIISRQKDKKLILVLDEYPYWRESSDLNKDGLDSALQQCIDRVMARANTKLIISGSYLSAMEEISQEKSPLAGRLRKSIYLKPMDYYEASLFYPSYSSRDKIIAYAAFGGLPFILETIDSSKDVLTNIENLYLKHDGELFKLIPLLIGEEIGKTGMGETLYEQIVKSEKKPNLKELSSLYQTRFTKEWIRKCLESLVAMDVIEKVFPIGETNEKVFRYIGAENAFDFYFRYVRPNEDSILLGNGKIAFNLFKEDFLKSYTPKIFEKAAKEFLIRASRKGLISPSIKNIGTYFYDIGNENNGQFDIVTLDEKGYIFYECKFHDLLKENIQEEKEQIASLPSFAPHPYALAFFSLDDKSKAEKKEYKTIASEEMFNADLL